MQLELVWQLQQPGLVEPLGTPVRQVGQWLVELLGQPRQLGHSVPLWPDWLPVER